MEHPSPKRGRRPPNFTAGLLWPNGWMDKDGTWYGGRHRPSDVVLDGKPAPKRCTVPSFWPMCIWPNGWMDEDATWYRSRPQPQPHCVTREPSAPPPRKGAQQLPLFGPCLLIVAMVAHLGYTAEHLSICGISFIQQSNISRVHTHRSFVAQKAQCLEQDNSLPVNLPQPVPAGRG